MPIYGATAHRIRSPTNHHNLLPLNMKQEDQSMYPASHSTPDDESREPEDRARKRPRIEPAGQVPAETLPERHPDLWFEDGNLIILSGTISFRERRID